MDVRRSKRLRESPFITVSEFVRGSLIKCFVIINDRDALSCETPKWHTIVIPKVLDATKKTDLAFFLFFNVIKKVQERNGQKITTKDNEENGI